MPEVRIGMSFRRPSVGATVKQAREIGQLLSAGSALHGVCCQFCKHTSV